MATVTEFWNNTDDYPSTWTTDSLTEFWNSTDYPSAFTMDSMVELWNSTDDYPTTLNVDTNTMKGLGNITDDYPTILNVDTVTELLNNTEDYPTTFMNTMTELWNATEVYQEWFNTSMEIAGNITEPEEIEAYHLLIPVISCVLILLNLPVVISTIVILRRGTEPRATYLFLGNVAFADLIMGAALLFDLYIPELLVGRTTCSIEMGLIVSSTLISVYSVGMIAIDRFLYILHGLKYKHLMSSGKTHVMLLFTWFLGVGLGFLPLMGWYASYEGDHCWFIHLTPPNLILLTVTIGCLPVILVCVLYSILLHHAIKKVLQLQRAKTAEGDNTNGLRVFSKNTSASKWRSVKVVALTTSSFVVTWVPYFTAATIFVFCDPVETPERYENLTWAIAGPLPMLGALNSVFNPFIYAWWHNGFRQNVKKILKIGKPKYIPPPKMTGSSNTSSARTSTTTLASNDFQNTPSPA